MKKTTKAIIAVIGLTLVLIVFFVYSQANQKPVIRINDLKIPLRIMEYDDLIENGYFASNKQDSFYYFQHDNAPDLYVGFYYNIINKRINVKDLVYYLGLNVDEKCKVIEIDEINFTKLSKQEILKNYDCSISFNGEIRFSYDDYFICLSYDDSDQLDGFAIMYDANEMLSLSDVDLDFRQYEWIN